MNKTVSNGQFLGGAVLGDFDKDGKLDIAVANESGVFLLRGNGDGSFAAPVAVSPPAKYGSLAVADLNGDGNPDLVVLSSQTSFDHLIVELLGNGDGTFQPPETLVTGPFYTTLNIADTNGDGRADLVLISSAYDSPVTVFLGNGDGTLQSPLTADTGGTYLDGFIVGDFNGDGVPDVAVTYWTGVSVLPGNGDGTLRAPIQTQLSTLPGGVTITGDFNGDGKLDIGYGQYSGAGVAFAFGNGDGTFQVGPALPIDADYSSGLVAGDFNGDGKSDFASISPNSTSVDVFLGGQFSGAGISSTHFGGFIAGQTGSYHLTVTNSAFATTNGTVTAVDNLPPGLTATGIGGTGWNCTLSSLTCIRSDALRSASSYPPITVTVNVAANLPASVVNNNASANIGGILNSAIDPTSILLPTTTTLSIAPNPATLGQPVTLTAAVPTGGAGTVLFLDNGVPLGAAAVVNGHAVLITRDLQAGLRNLSATYAGDQMYGPSRSPETFATVRSLSANSFAPAATYATGSGPQAIATADFNHDGIADLVTANSGNTISVLLGVGDGSFRPKVDYPVGGNPTNFLVADFNNDGNPDLAVSGEFSNIAVLLGNPDGTFQSAIRFAYGSGEGLLVASDFNGDGKVDLLDFESNGTVLLLGNGDGTFQPPATIAGGSIGSGVVADFRRSGEIDFITDNSTVFLGNGDGTFQSSSLYSIFPGGEVVVGDLNGDGKPDLVSLLGNVYVSLGNGDGSFQVNKQYGTNIANSQYPVVLLADVDGDGKLDVLAGDSYQPGLSVLLGNGDGTLQPTHSLLANIEPQSIIAGDFNGDGRTDLAFLSPNSSVVTILLGAFTPTLTIASTHADPFTLGQSGAIYTITVNNTSNAPTFGAVTVTETLPAGLTPTGMSGAGWNCTLADLSCTRSDSLPAGAAYAAITLTVNVTAGNTGSVTNQVSESGGGAPAEGASDPTTIIGASIALSTNPPGLLFSVDGGPVTTSAAWNPAPGVHTIAVVSTQPGSTGTRYVFNNWNDGGAASHTITVGASPATYTANFKTQYQLTTKPLPALGGTVIPASGTYSDSGSTVTLTATPNSPYVFTSWSGDATGATNPISVTMDAAKSAAANFNVPGFSCDLKGNGVIDVSDVQLIINEALGQAQAVNDLNGGGVVNVIDVQIEINASLGLGCAAE